MTTRAQSRVCEYCQVRNATHFCSGCGKWVCDDARCMSRAAIKTIKAKVASIYGR